MDQNPPAIRACFFIDGFNFYHSLDENPDLHKYKWLDYAKLARLFVPRNEKIERILLFTAFPTWNSQKEERHKRYVNALRTKGVEIVFGKFKRRSKVCHSCKNTIAYHEEKETDVNIAVELFRLAIRDEFDEAYLVSGDTDLVPAVRGLKSAFPSKIIRVIFPLGRVSEDFRSVADGIGKVKRKHLESAQLEDVIVLSNGAELRRPEGWK